MVPNPKGMLRITCETFEVCEACSEQVSQLGLVLLRSDICCC